MKAVGIIVEYNPFHNGHLYHLEYVKKKYPNYCIIAIMSGNFMQRGQVSLISKWDKTEMALHYGVDIVLDLPFVFANESADFFASNTIKILNHFKIEKIIFGSESNDKELYYELAKIQLYNDQYNIIVRQYLRAGLNYPTACSRALSDIEARTVKMPNDILGLAYVKAIMKNNFKIGIDVLQRTNSFHSTEISSIASATSIRKAIQSNKSYQVAVPEFTYQKIMATNVYDNDMFLSFLRYKITSSTLDDLKRIHLVDEGIEARIQSVIIECSCYDDLVKAIATKRYTNSRVSRMLLNILMNFTKAERELIENQTYYRVLGFSIVGQSYLSYLKKLGVSYDVSIKNIKNNIADIEYRCSRIIRLINRSYNENDIIKKQTVD